MIPAEAVEAATDALVASKLGDHPGINGEEFVEAAIAALEAAAPHMLREAWESGCRKGLSFNPGYDDEALAANPYRPTP